VALAAQIQIPVLGELFREGEAVCLGAAAPVAAVEEGGALPLAAVLTSVDVNGPTKQVVCFVHGSNPFEAKTV
jgi:hypothetical protein